MSRKKCGKIAGVEMVIVFAREGLQGNGLESLDLVMDQIRMGIVGRDFFRGNGNESMVQL